MNVKIGTKIKALRKRDDITQERLAEALGVTGQAISKWESGSSYPDIEYITPIANFFNVTTDFLFDHDIVEKRRKIDEYCERYDALAIEEKPAQERVDMMRQALAEFPAEEKLLYRLAEALDSKWRSYGYFTAGYVDGYFIDDYETPKSFDCWEEAAAIMEELLATSLDDTIRSGCRTTLIYLYARIGEKDKALALAEKCDELLGSKESLLAVALDGKDGVMHEQRLIMILLYKFCSHFLSLGKRAQDKTVINEAYGIVINLHKFIYSDGNYGYWNDNLKRIYKNYAYELIWQNQFDEAVESLENAYNHAKMFDIYLNQIRKEGEFKYTAPYVNLTKDISKDISASKELPYLLKSLKDEDDRHYKKLHEDPRYTALIRKIEADISEEE